jgi:transposase
MHNYSSDVTREEFEIVRADLEAAKKITKPRKLDLYDIFCAVLYVVKSGCQWRMLPANFPKWEIVYYYFSVWSKADGEGVSALDRTLKKIGAPTPKRRSPQG